MNLLNCLGVVDVANNKETDTNEIQVTLPSEFPSQDGENLAGVNEDSTSHVSTSGNVKSGKVLMGNTVPATWMPLNTNRITAPDVRVGSKVILYQFKNSNKYFWTLHGLNGSMRLETIVYAISASPNINENTPITPDNYYILTISSHKKKIELLTGQGNGEAVGYQFTIDLDQGWFGSMDSLGQIFLNNSVERSLTYINKDKTQLSIDKKNFTLLNQGETLFDTKESVTVKSKNITFLASEKITIRAGEAEVDVNGNYSEKIGGSQTVNISGKQSSDVTGGVNITTPKVDVSQVLNVGSQITSPSIKAGGDEVTKHIHKTKGEGKPTEALGA